jgi:hypothetical protein
MNRPVMSRLSRLSRRLRLILVADEDDMLRVTKMICFGFSFGASMGLALL